MRKQILCLFVFGLLFLGQILSGYANNLRLDGTVKVTEVSGNIATLEFSMRWDNAWRDSYNWDAVWVFLKYKTTGSPWQPVFPEATGHVFSGTDGKSYTFLPGATDGRMSGLFVLLNEPAACNPVLTCRVKWTLPAGLTKASFENNDAFLMAQGVEMVYVPFGAYQLGDATASDAFAPVIIDSEGARSISRQDAPEIPIALSAGYPKGYGGFHLMKYEVSQEQVVAFLNTLTLAQQQELLPQHASLKSGDYIFGNPQTPTYRNGIILTAKPDGAPMLFENNLTADDKFGQADDGKYIPCNYISVQMMLAYCAWAGLRPPTELEFEKACRRPLPDLPVDGEYVWGGVATPVFASGIVNGASTSEGPSSGQVNASGLLNGPLRCGSFAARAAGQQSSGASYWGIMELGGNLREICATATNTGIASSVHGSGSYATNLWGSAPSDYGFRGGSFASAAGALQACDRSETKDIVSLSAPDSTAGFRGARTFALDGGGGIRLDPGTIALDGGGTSVCPGKEIVINNTASASVSGMDNLPVSYLWYVDDVALAETGETLRLTSLTNTGTSPVSHTIRRKAICMVGEAETSTLDVSVLPAPDFTLSATSAGIDIEGKTTSVTATASVTGVTLTFRWLYRGTELVSGTAYTPAAAHFSNVPGTYTVTCEAVSGSCSGAPIRKDITVKYTSQTAGTIAIADGVTSICPEGKTIAVTNTSPATVSTGETVVYSWKVNGAVLGSQNQATLSYVIPKNSGNSAVSYSIIRVATTSEGVKETAPLSVSIRPWPNFSISPASVAFATTENGPVVTATASSSGNSLSYVWKYGSSTVSSANTYTPLAATFGSTDGSYTVVCTSSVSGCTATATQNLAVALSTCGGDFTDPRDGKSYPTVKVGNQCWMAKNLNIGTFTPIIMGGGAAGANTYTFDEVGIQKWCIGGTGSNISTSNEANCNTYGGLYEWWEVVCGGYCDGKMTPAKAQSTSLSSESQLAAYGAKMVSGTNMVQGICPDGWHLPSDAEWTTLNKVAAGWNVLLGGYRNANGSGFYGLGSSGYWWSSTPNGSYAYGRYLSSTGVGTVFSRTSTYRSYGFSVRCVRN